MTEQDFAERNDGKTRHEEAVDSAQMLATALLASILIMAVVVLVVWLIW